MTQNRVSWQIDPRRAALLIHDMQAHYLEPFGNTPLLAELVRNIKRLRAYAQAHEVPVIFTGQPACQTKDERGLNYDFWGPGMTAPEQANFVANLIPTSTDTVIFKRRYSAFHETNLAKILRDRKRDQLIVCGVYARFGCLISAQHAFMHNIQPFVVIDAMGDFTLESHRQGIAFAATSCARLTITNLIVDSSGNPDQPLYSSGRSPVSR